MKTWVNKWLSDDSADELINDKSKEALVDLDLKAALDTHRAWKIKLEDELSGHSTSPIDVDVIASDCQCTLGKWLHSTGENLYSEYEQYHSAVEAHANFHIVASEVVKEHQQGDTDTAKNLLKSKFRTASNNNQLQITNLFSAVNS